MSAQLENTSPLGAQRSMTPEQYDLVIIGSGVGSKLAAWTLAGKGQRVAVVERRYVGGSCPNIACLPSKNVIHSAKVASLVWGSEAFGVNKTGFNVDMASVRSRKRNMVTEMVNAHLDLFKRSGAEVIMGSGRFMGPKTIEVTLPDGKTRRLRGTNVIIGTGTRAALDPIPGLVEAKPLTHVEALELDVVPEQLLVIGAGYVGLELSQAMMRFGSKVSVIERGGRLLPREDQDISEALQSMLEKEGLSVVLNARVKAVSGTSGQIVKVVLEQNGIEKTLIGTHLLVATGRIPNTDGLGVEFAGVELTDRGYVKVNQRLETTASGVWGVGDVTGGPQFTHIGHDDFRVVSENILGGNRVTTGRQVPFCLFTDPELARVGLNEIEARQQGVAYRLFTLPMAGVLRTHTLSETQGFMKALVEKNGDRILGFTTFGVNAGEIMSAVQIAMLAGLPFTSLRDAVLAHPTLMEGLGSLFASAPSNHD
ncbi:MAG: FAD-dependent oxidoreductase [Verrucomicrobiota bacterium]|jgi:pyruvate/2-oxoglutarate dehydrogenase complex dihydrolipoamide dehydrogenase (E3) component